MLENRATRNHFNEHGVPKRGYGTQVEAERWAKLLHAVGRSDKLLGTYCCGICGEWHLGHSTTIPEE